MSGVAILYLSWNRREFVEATLPQLLEATDWSVADSLTIYDDGSEDGAKELCYELVHRCPVSYSVVETPNIGPVGIMNHFVGSTDAERFLKCDSDIMLPDGYLPALVDVMDFNRHIDALGMEAGRCGLADVETYGYEGASHIGGVGLIRTAALGTKPKIRANGRWGWTEFQSQHHLGCAWIKPDLLVFSLDQLPFEPWQSLADQYVEREWARRWGSYHRKWMYPYWDWMFPDWEEQPFRESAE